MTTPFDSANEALTNLFNNVSDLRLLVGGLTTRVGALEDRVAPSRLAMPTAPTPDWTRIFASDFNEDCPASAFPQRFSPYMTNYPPSYQDTSNRGWYGNNHDVVDGCLRQHIWTDPKQVHVASLIPFLNPMSGTKYRGAESCRVTVRVKADRMPGFKMAWLLWPEGDATNTYHYEMIGTPPVKTKVPGGWGEVDFIECDLAGGKIGGFLHYEGATTGSDQLQARSVPSINDWNTVTLTWIKGQQVRMEANGAMYMDTSKRIPNHPMRLSMQTETVLDLNTPIPTTDGYVYIDWMIIETLDQDTSGGIDTRIGA